MFGYSDVQSEARNTFAQIWGLSTGVTFKGNVITKETNKRNNRVHLVALLFVCCRVSFVLRNLCLGNLQPYRRNQIWNKRIEGHPKASPSKK